jgi:ferredoxin
VTGLRVAVDRHRCCASGNCVLIAPDVFDQADEDGLVVLRTDTPPGDLHSDVREAVEVCPVAAISLRE